MTSKAWKCYLKQLYIFFLSFCLGLNLIWINIFSSTVVWLIVVYYTIDHREYSSNASKIALQLLNQMALSIDLVELILIFVHDRQYFW